MTTVETFGVCAVAVFHVGMGLLALAQPGRIMGLFGVPLPTPQGRNEISAVYGGFGLAVAAALVFALSRAGETSNGIRIQVAVALFGMAAGRVVAFVRDRQVQLYPSVLFLGLEVAMAAMAWPWSR